jgi:hypothetical protein
VGPRADVDSSGNIVHSSGPLVALVGVRDLVVVITPDVALVCPKDRTQEIRNLIRSLSPGQQDQYL